MMWIILVFLHSHPLHVRGNWQMSFLEYCEAVLDPGPLTFHLPYKCNILTDSDVIGNESSVGTSRLPVKNNKAGRCRKTIKSNVEDLIQTFLKFLLKRCWYRKINISGFVIYATG